MSYNTSSLEFFFIYIHFFLIYTHILHCHTLLALGALDCTKQFERSFFFFRKAAFSLEFSGALIKVNQSNDQLI